MPYAVTHILLAIILIELFREYFVKNKQTFPRYYILIAAIGGILPDFDYIFVYILYPFGFNIFDIHPTYSHILILPLALFIIGFTFSKYKVKSNKLGKRHMNLAVIFYILAATSLLHIALDTICYDVMALFYPFSTQTFGLNLAELIPLELRDFAFATLDGILLLFWLVWMQFKLKIDDYF